MFQNYRFDKKDPAQCHAFEIHGVDLAIVNGIRRTILTDVEVVGFSGEEDPSVDIITNTGRLHNEIMMHRFGLIPVHLDEIETDSFVEGQYVAELNKRNTSDDMINITTHDFKVFKDDKALSDKHTHDMFPVDMVSNSPILITRLRPGEALHVKCTAVKRTARFHAGFSPVSHCTFFYLQDQHEAATKNNILDREKSYLKNEYGDPIAFQFEIEPKIKLSPRYLVTKAIDILIGKLTRIQQDIYDDESDYTRVENGDTGGVNFVINGEDDTIGNIIQSYIHVHHVRAKKQAANGAVVSYVGYYCPHPLDSTVVINVRMNGENVSKKEYTEFMAIIVRSIITQLQDMMNVWLQFAPKN